MIFLFIFLFFIKFGIRAHWILTWYQNPKALTSNFDLSASASHKAINPIPFHHSKKKISPTHNHYKALDLPSIYKTEEKSSRSKLTGALTRGNYPRKHSPRRQTYQVPNLQHSGIDQQKGNHKSVDWRPIYSKPQKTKRSNGGRAPRATNIFGREIHAPPEDSRALRQSRPATSTLPGSLTHGSPDPNP